MRFSAEVIIAGMLGLASAASLTGSGAVGTVYALPTTALGLGLANAEERITWDRPTLRVGDGIFAALHYVLLLRGEHETQAWHLATDSRVRPALHWGRDRWAAVRLGQVSDQVLPGLLSEARGLASGKKR